MPLMTSLAFGISLNRAVVLGLCMAVTALPVAVRTLESFKLLNSSIAHSTIAIAIVNDIIVFLALGLLLKFNGASGPAELAKSACVSIGKVGALLLRSELFGAARFQEPSATIRSVTNELLAPVFFAFIGLAVNIRSPRSASFVATVIILSIVSKVLAGRIGGKLAHLSAYPSGHGPYHCQHGATARPD